MTLDNIQINAELEEIITELRNQCLQNGINYFGKIKDSGDDIMVSCPYHKEGQERRPSAGIRKQDGMLHCFTCGETHNLQEVISHCFGKDDAGMFGWQWLIRNFGTVEREERKDVELDYIRNFSGKYNKSRTDEVSNKEQSGVNKAFDRINKDFVTEELDKYRYYHPYWKERGIIDDNIIELFDLGYDKSTKCITFPVRDIHGHTLFVARRSVYKKQFFYPKGVEKPLYGLYELYSWGKYNVSMNVGSIGEVIVCESMIDALTCWQWGKYAVATNGTQVSELQFKQLRDLHCRMLILAMDNDEAGRKAMQRIRKHIKNKIIKEYVLPEGRKDINELSKEEFENLREVF